MSTKPKFLQIAISSAVILAALLTGCAPPAPATTAPEAPTAQAVEPTAGPAGPRYTIGVSAQLVAHDWSIKGWEGMQEKAAELNVELIQLSAGQDPAKQLADIESFVEQKVDGIIVMLAETGVLEQAIKKTTAAGIPVVFMDGGYQAPGVITNISSDNCQIGKDAARFIAQKLNGKGNVVLQTYPPLEATNRRTICAKEVWAAEFPDIKILEEQPILGPEWTADAQAHAESMLAKYGTSVDAIGVCCDLLSTGASPAVDAAKLGEKIIVTGTDGQEQAMQMIADPNSSYELTFLQDSKQMGRVAVETMVKFLDAGGKIPQPEGSKIVEPVVLIPSILITKDNVAQYIK